MASKVITTEAEATSVVKSFVETTSVPAQPGKVLFIDEFSKWA